MFFKVTISKKDEKLKNTEINELTQEQKTEVSKRVVKLDGRQLGQVVKIIKTKCPSSFLDKG